MQTGLWNSDNDWRYQTCPLGCCSSSSESVFEFMLALYHRASGALAQCKPFSSGSSVDVLMTLVGTPLALRQA